MRSDGILPLVSSVQELAGFTELRNAIDSFNLNNEQINRTLFLAARTVWSDLHTVMTLQAAPLPDQNIVIGMLTEARDLLPDNPVGSGMMNDRQLISDALLSIPNWGQDLGDDEEDF